ncbi:MAG: DNA polymerase I [Planctomycetota bacterium]
MSTLYLIDGYAQFFRAYHAIRTPMTSPVTGEPTNATFGFVGMLLKILREEEPSHLAVAMDVSGDRGTFRSELYPAYKATRDAPPEDLGVQVERCVSILEAIGVPRYGAEGYEADDVIATIVDRMAVDDASPKVRIVSKDKDLRQLLVADRVEMYDVHTGDLMDTARLHEDFGISPGQVVDMLALMGDTADNVPGVAGIGPKTAAKLVAEYGSIDALLEDAGNIKGKRGENIRAATETLALSRRLVTLVRDIDMPFALDDARTQTLDLEALEPILRELGFNRFRDELRALVPGAEASGAPQPEKRRRASDDQGGLFDAHNDADTPAREASGAYTLVHTESELTDLCERLRGAGVFAIDTETTSVNPMRAELCGISVSDTVTAGAYIPTRSPDPDSHLPPERVIGLMRPLLEDPSVGKVGHNLKYDLIVLRRAGVELRGVVGDSMIASFILDASRSSHGMDHLALSLLGHSTIPISDLIGTGKKQRTFDTVALDVAAEYAAEDADISLRLHERFCQELDQTGLAGLYEQTELALMPVLAELEWNGVRVDPDELDRQAERLNAQIEELRSRIEENSPRPFNPDSPKQLSGVLFNSPDDIEEPGLGIKPLTKTKTGYSTNAEVLEKLASDPAVESPVPGLIVGYRQLTKLVSTYLVALKEAIHPETRRVHASFNQTVASTGRLSSSDPNLQNIPIRTPTGREIRRAFVADEGNVLIGGDYSQIELRMLAHLSQDPALIEAFERGEDIHRAVAAQIHEVDPGDVTPEQRSGAKMVNFGIVYGITAFGLARRLGVGNDEAGSIIDGYKRRFAGITTFLEECVAFAQAHGYVETIMGRRRPIAEIDSRQPNRRALAERMAINSVVQGSAADLIKVAMIRMHSALRPERSLVPLADDDAWALPAGVDAGRVRMLLQIHDELVLEAPEAMAEPVGRWMELVMEGAMSLRVPLVVKASWARDWFSGK